MDSDTEFLKEKMAQYRRDIAPLVRYLPWLKEASASAAATYYKGEGMDQEGSLSFPVYDSTLMGFIREASNSPLMDRNYPYVYTRKNIKTAAQERAFIEAAVYTDWDSLCGILSRYVLGGRTMARLWSEGVTEQIFFLVIDKMSKIVTEWDPERNARQ